MRLSIDELMVKSLQNDTTNPQRLEIIESQDASALRGGDREPTRPVYEFEYTTIWQKASMLLDNLK